MAKPSWQQAVDAWASSGRTIGQQWYDIQGPDFKKNNSAASVAAYARSQGYGLGDAWQASYGSAPLPPPAISQDNRLRQNLRIAGQDNNLGKKELKAIAKANDVSLDVIVRNLDKVNANSNLKIGIGSGAAQQIIKNPYGDRKDPLYATYASNFGGPGPLAKAGDGKIANTLRDYIGTTPFKGTPTNGVLEGRLPALTAGNQVNFRGGVTTIMPASRNSGGTYSAPPAPTNTAPSTQPTSDIPVYTPPTIETPEPQYGPGGASSALDGGATGFRSRRSRWRNAGKTSKGTANLKIMGQTGSSSGLNLAIGGASAGMGMFR